MKQNRVGVLMRFIGVVASAGMVLPAQASELKVDMNVATESGVGSKLGVVVVSESRYGLVFTPTLDGLTAGLHGFHIHEKASCEPTKKEGKIVAAGAAGGHLDPAGAKSHGAPWGEGHLGDLPALTVDTKGSSSNPVLAPRLKLSDVRGKALMIHAGGDNHSDAPAPLGGGGARIACGVIPS